MGWRFRIANEDCFLTFAKIPDGKVDLVLCDPPYGSMGAVGWDNILPMDRMWAEIRRVLKPLGVVVLTAMQPFTTDLINAARDIFKYTLVWEKTRIGDRLNAKVRPMRAHEDVLVFSAGHISTTREKGRMPYYPQGLVPCHKITDNRSNAEARSKTSGSLFAYRSLSSERRQTLTGYPKTVLKFESVLKPVHPTQKPVELFEYLIRTYSQEGEIVLDFTMGSGTTGVAAARCGRRFIGAEADTERGYFANAERRIKEAYGDEG